MTKSLGSLIILSFVGLGSACSKPGSTAGSDPLGPTHVATVNGTRVPESVFRLQTLASLRAGTIRFKSIDLNDRKIRLYGSTALVTSRAEVTATGPEGNISGSYRYTRVYVKDAHGAWRIVSFEASKIKEPKAHR